MPVDRKELQELSKIRLREASALLKLDLFDGAYYLAGYAVECGLKACITKGTQRFDFPDRKRVESSYSHNLRELIKVAGLDEARLQHAERNPNFGSNWDTVVAWFEQSRYRRHLSETAELMLTAVGDKRHGVISWIKLQW